MKLMSDNNSPIRPYKTIIDDSGHSYTNRILIGTAVTGLVRIEWARSRYEQVIPVNWSNVIMHEPIPGMMPLRYLVADAQNLIVKAAIERDFEWLLLWEHDVLAPTDTLLRLNEYMLDTPTPVVSGLYYTRSRPSTPLVFRGRGTSVYKDWEIGDKVWVDGVPTGMLLIHCGLLKLMWEDSEEYVVKGRTTRRVFDTPRKAWFDPQRGSGTVSGTSDLEWCTRVIEGDYLRKAGWDEFADKEYPFLMDTSIFCRHINPDGEQFP